MNPPDLTARDLLIHQKDLRIQRFLQSETLRATKDGDLWHLTQRFGWRRVSLTHFNGYLRGGIVSPTMTRGREIVFAHRVVAIAFLGLPKTLMQVNHINGIKSDNRPGNLEWTTPLENTRHAHKLGIAGSDFCWKGADNTSSKLSEVDVAKILKAHLDGAPRKQLADEFLVSVGTIENVIYGKTYPGVARPSKEIIRAAAVRHQVAGERHGHAKLTPEKVLMIRREFRDGVLGDARRLGQKFGVDVETVRDIVKRRTWRHLK